MTNLTVSTFARNFQGFPAARPESRFTISVSRPHQSIPCSLYSSHTGPWLALLPQGLCTCFPPSV